MIPLTLAAAALACVSPRATDGDTIRCANLGAVRILHIDAPELPGHCRPGRVCTPGDGWASKAAMARLLTRGNVVCDPVARDVYHRLLATCRAARLDLGCAMVSGHFAVERYGRLHCVLPRSMP